jgi:CheY-like chemotaxis protein
VLAVEQGRANRLSVSCASILDGEFVLSDKLRVLTADDDIRMRYLIVRLLRDEFEVIGDVGSGRELVQAALTRNPDVIVSDVAMPLPGGVEAIRELRAAGQAIPFVLISSVFCRAGVGNHTGAVAYVDKSDLQFDLVSAVRSAALGRPFHSRSIYR